MPSVPYIKSHMPLHQPGSIAEIIIGPAAPSDAEEFACSLLGTFHRDPCRIIRRSTKPITCVMYANLPSGEYGAQTSGSHRRSLYPHWNR